MSLWLTIKWRYWKLTNRIGFPAKFWGCQFLAKNLTKNLTNIWVSFERLVHKRSNIGNDCQTRNWLGVAKRLVKAEEEREWTPITIVRSIWNWLRRRFANPRQFIADNCSQYLIACAPTAELLVKPSQIWSNFLQKKKKN